jgi:pimeloyl-ACP methyl ester carboxylesterase
MPTVDGVTHSWVEAQGLRFHVAEAGAGDDPVLLLHGWPQHWYEWRHLMPALADRHRVLAMDLRGFGWSDAPRDGYEKESLASDVLAVLDELGLERVKLVGHDWGGWVSFLLCLRAPERFDRYLALNIPPPWIQMRKALPHSWRLLYQAFVLAPGIGYLAHRRKRFVRMALRAGGADPRFWDERALSVFADNLAEPSRARAAVQMYRVFNLRELVPVLRGRYADKRLTVPTRMLFGTDDAAIHPDLLAGYEAHADDMEIELVPGCGHFIADERPNLVAERALAFFDGLSQSTSPRLPP